MRRPSDHLIILTDSDSGRHMTELMQHYGEHASFEAAARAAHSRDQGNHVNFCRWRQIERMLNALDGAPGSVH